MNQGELDLRKVSDAVLQEREACAKLCEDRAAAWKITLSSNVVAMASKTAHEVVEAHMVEATNIAAEIRSRSV